MFLGCAIRYEIYSEGWGDVCTDKALACQLRSTIKINNGRDYSKHGRGINFAVFNAETGTFF